MMRVDRAAVRPGIAAFSMALALVLAVRAEVPEIVRTFRPARYTRGNTNVFRQQPIDSASWIWKADAPDTCFLYFQKDFEVRPGDGDLVIDVSADERFVLMLDGRFVARGPNRGTVQNWQYHTYTIKNLAPGAHTLTAKAWTLGSQAPLAQQSYRGGFILKAAGVYDERLTTGTAEWQVAVCDTIKTLPIENSVWGTGCRFEIRDWDAAPRSPAWEKAAVVRGPAGMNGNNGWGVRTDGWMLFPSQLPDQTETVLRPGEFKAATRQAPWRGEHVYTDDETRSPEVALFNAKLRDPAQPLVVPPRTRLQLAWHLGRYTCAYPMLTASGDGARVSWSWTESAREPSSRRKRQRDALAGKFLDGYGDEFICGAEPVCYTTPWFRSGLWCRIDVETGDRPLEIHDLSLVESRYPIEMESAFAATGQDDLQDIRRICARAMQMCAHEMFFDCPYYEQQMYPGDTRVQLNVVAALSRDDRLVKRAIEIYDLATRDDGTCPMNFPTRMTQESMAYTLCYLCMFGDYAMNHADFDWLRARVPGMRKSMSGVELYENAEGLLENIPGWCFMDWVAEWTFGCAPKSRFGEGPSAAVNLFWALALESAATTERALGNEHQAAHWEAKLRHLKAAILKTFWCEERGLLADTPDFKHFSEHAQALAICAGVLEGERRDRAFANLIDGQGLARCSVYFSYYLFEAYFKMGRGDLFLRRLDLWRDYLRLGVTTLLEDPEDFGQDGKKEARSDCHAWGAHPIWFMQTGLAGIRSGAPGFGRVTVAPVPGPLPRLSAKHPHPKGWIEVELEFADGAATGTISTPVPGEFVFGGRRQELRPGKNVVGSAAR